MDKGALLEAIEKFIGGEPEPQLTRFKLASGRELTVLSSMDAPGSNLITHALIDAPFSEWPDLKKGFRVLPICVVDPVVTEAPLWLAHVYDWCLSKGVVPQPHELIPTLGPSKSLPHARMDYAFPWEDEGPAQLTVGQFKLLPVLVYPVTDREAQLQHEQGPDALDEDLETRQAPVFSWDRALD